MNKEDRQLWMRAAYAALKDIPFDLLERGAKVALATCTHPSKIVPAILDEVSEAARWRVENAKPLRIAAPSKVKDEPLDRDLLDRMQNANGTLLAAVRDVGMAKGYIYLAEDGRLHQSFEAQGRAA